MTFANPFKVRFIVCAAALLLACASAQAQVGGAGTPGKIAKFKSPNSVGDSVIFEDKFGMVGVGTSLPTSKLTVAGMIESLTGGIKFPDGTIQTTAGVSSISHEQTLTGNGTAGTPLGIANGGVGTQQIADNAVSAGKISSGQVVRSLNGVTDHVKLAAGPNITITPNGNTLTIASSVKDPALSAFQTVLEIDYVVGGASNTDSFTVPFGKRLVIEYITIKAYTGPGSVFTICDLTTTVNGVDVPHSIIPFRVGTVSSEVLAVHEKVRIYADGEVVLFAKRGGTEISGNITLTISGYLVDLP